MEKVDVKVKGGFPPLNYVDTEIDANKKKSTRERSFASTIKKNINVGIREILKDSNNSKPIIDINQSDEQLTVLESF
jgi:hypothetical protein